MIRLLLTIAFFFPIVHSSGLKTAERSLRHYIETAKENSPFINDYNNKKAIQRSELQRLKTMYMRSKLELNGNWLFVPVISTEEGHAAFKWNAQDGADYYGYDLGESSGHIHAGITWTQPLLGRSMYKTAAELAEINEDIENNRISMEEHQLERTVTEQYLLCLLDKIELQFSDSISLLLDKQICIIQKFVKDGLSDMSDLDLLIVEKNANEGYRATYRQSYHSHLMDMNLLCGIDDTSDVLLEDIDLVIPSKRANGYSRFTEQYRLDSLNTETVLHNYLQQYKPRLDLFVNGGMQTGGFAGWYKHFGWNAGVTFSWIIYDGRQKRQKERQARFQQNSIQIYKDYSENRRKTAVDKCLSELVGYDKRIELSDKRVALYETILSDYDNKLKAGQLSVIDYITILKSRIQTEKERMMLQTDRQLIIVSYNYWNW